MQTRSERDNLDELIAGAEAEHGPITEEEIAAKRAELARARDVEGWRVTHQPSASPR